MNKANKRNKEKLSLRKDGKSKKRPYSKATKNNNSKNKKK